LNYFPNSLMRILWFFAAFHTFPHAYLVIPNVSAR
jgi:hypothetical protein